MTDEQRDKAMLIILETLSDSYEILGLLRYHVFSDDMPAATRIINYRKNVISELLKAIREKD